MVVELGNRLYFMTAVLTCVPLCSHEMEKGSVIIPNDEELTNCSLQVSEVQIVPFEVPFEDAFLEVICFWGGSVFMFSWWH